MMIPDDRLALPLDQLPLVFLDVETTGLYPGAGHRVCEVALVRAVGERTAASFATLVDPQRDLDAGAAAVNGITPALLAGAPPFAAVADALLALLDGAVLVAHNAPFDCAFLAAELARLGRPAPAEPALDTLVLSRRLLRRSSHSLRALAADLGLPAPTHRALSDTLALRGLFAFLAGRMALVGVHTLGDTLRLQRGLLPGQPDPVPPPPIDQALAEGRMLRIVYASNTTLVPVERLVRPLDLTLESSGLYLRAFCYLRNDVRSFVLSKIEAMELV